MYTGFLHLHGGLRWLVLLILLVVIFKYLTGWLSNASWKKADNILGIVLTSLMDIQLLVGLVLYFFLSPITKTAFQDVGAAMKNADLRFYLVEHFLLMILAVAFVHIGRARSKKATNSKARFGKALFWVVLSTILIVVSIPWERV